MTTAASYSLRYSPALQSQLNHWNPMGGSRKCCVVAFPKSQLGKASPSNRRPELLNAFPRGETVPCTAHHLPWLMKSHCSFLLGNQLLKEQDFQERQAGWKSWPYPLLASSTPRGGNNTRHPMSLVQPTALEWCPQRHFGGSRESRQVPFDAQ